jgi:hypothetical protein
MHNVEMSLYQRPPMHPLKNFGICRVHFAKSGSVQKKLLDSAETLDAPSPALEFTQNPDRSPSRGSANAQQCTAQEEF